MVERKGDLAASTKKRWDREQAAVAEAERARKANATNLLLDESVEDLFGGPPAAAAVSSPQVCSCPRLCVCLFV